MIFPPLASLLSLHLFHFKNCDLIHSSLFLHLSIFKKSRENNVGNDSTLARENLHVKTKNDTFVRRERFPLPLLSCATAILIIAHGHILYPKKDRKKLGHKEYSHSNYQYFCDRGFFKHFRTSQMCVNTYICTLNYTPSHFKLMWQLLIHSNWSFLSLSCHFSSPVILSLKISPIITTYEC